MDISFTKTSVPEKLTSQYSVISEGAFQLQDLPGFPYTAWESEQTIYKELEAWYSGAMLNDYTIDKVSLKKIEKYPIKINPLRGTCEKHSSALFGQTVDSLTCGGIPVRILADTTDKKISEEDATRIQNALLNVFADNGGGSLFSSNGIISQYLRGCVFTARWLANEEKIMIDNPSPKEFFGIPDGTNYWKLKKAWIIREIDKETAMTYDVPVNINDTKFYYVEEWSETFYRVMINGRVIKIKGELQEGNNIWGFVPIMYIPHIRTTGFLGNSIISEMVKGLIREINLRWADVGDAVSDDSHQPVAIRNVRSTPKQIVIDSRRVIDLGSSTGLAAGESNPDMITVSLKSASDVMLKLGDSLYDMYRREVNHPSVADGEDSGSQRSSLTLGVKMWALIAHIEQERAFWTVGLGKFAQILLKMMKIKGLDSITENDTKAKLKIVWSPILPMDRKALIDELAIRSANKLGSQKHLMTLVGDIQDVEKEEEIIEEEAKAAQALLPKPEPFGGSDSGGAGPGGKTPPKKNKETPNTPAPKSK